MNIESINSNKYSYSTNSEKKNKTGDYNAPQMSSQSYTRTDRLELSSEARNLQPIAAKILSGMYDKPEVILETAKAINNAFPREI